MTVYKVKLELFVSADSKSEAENAALEELAYLCGLDNSLMAANITASEIETAD